MTDQIRQSATKVLDETTNTVNDTVKDVAGTVKNTFKWYFYMMLTIGALIVTGLGVGIYKLATM
jgi:hypothetical protein